MKKVDIKTNSDADLVKGLSEKRSSLASMKFNLAGSKLKNTREQRGVKKDIARLLTEMNSRVENTK